MFKVNNNDTRTTPLLFMLSALNMWLPAGFINDKFALIIFRKYK